VVEGVDGLARWFCCGGGRYGSGAAAKSFQQRRPDGARIENRFEAPRRQILNLLIRQIDALTLGDAGANVQHDLFDVNLVSASLDLLRLRSTIDPAPVGTSPAPVKMSTAPFLIVIHRFSTF
jgi:hypothetical protein